MPKLSVNLITYNGEKYISPCLMSVMAQTFRDFSVLIIDNGSTDRIKAEIKKWEKILLDEEIAVKVIYLENNLGFAEGHNMGIREVQSLKFKVQNGDEGSEKFPISNFQFLRYICCLNQDVILAPDYLQKVVEFMDAHSDCASASGKLLRLMKNANKREYESELTRIDYSYLARECKIIDSGGLKVFKSRRTVEIGQGEDDNGQYNDIKEVFGVSGAVPLFRMVALEDVKISQKSTRPNASGEREVKKPALSLPKDQKSSGEGGSFEYFDKDFGNYKEDVDLAYRLRWRGWKSYVIPKAVAYHKRGAKQLSEKMGDFTVALNRKNKSKYINYCSQRNQLWTLVKNMDTLNFATFWYEAKKFGYELLFEWSTFKAWFDIFKKIGVMKEKRKWIMKNRKISAEEMSKWHEK